MYTSPYTVEHDYERCAVFFPPPRVVVVIVRVADTKYAGAAHYKHTYGVCGT